MKSKTSLPARGTRFFWSTLVVAGVVSGGLLECSRPRTPVEIEGERTYARMCAVCHGKGGEGYAADRAPSLDDPDFLASATGDYIRKAIENGRAGSTMSAWSRSRGGPLNSTEVDALIIAMRTWGTHQKATLDEGALNGDATKGADVFARECASCHGEHGVGGTYVQIGNAELLGSATNGFLRYAIRRGRPSKGMLSFETKLGAPAIDDVVAYLRSVQKAASPQLRPTAAKAPPLPLGPIPLNPKGPEPDGFKAMPSMTSAEVIKRELDRGAKMVIMDARAPSDFMMEHVAGAVSVPFYDPEPYFSQLPRDVWLVAYCGCPHAESGTLARKLLAEGFTKVTVLDEGLGYWRSHNYPLQSADPRLP